MSQPFLVVAFRCFFLVCVLALWPVHSISNIDTLTRRESMFRSSALARGALKLRDPRLLKNAAFINGKFIEARGKSLDVFNPATLEVIGTIPAFGPTETNEAVAAAKAALPAWGATFGKLRGQKLFKWEQLMLQNEADMAALINAEGGKPLKEAAGENAYSAGYVHWYAGEAERIQGDILSMTKAGCRPTVVKKPVGVVAIITPWNFPSAMITRAAAGAIAAGCTVVVKPASSTPLTALALAQLASDAGFPPGVFNVVTGTAGPIGQALMENSDVRKLCFTGSTSIGKYLMAGCAATVKRTSMELGGNAPFIVFDDADIDAAVKGCVASKFRNAGQTCICTNRVFVQKKIESVFIEKLVREIQTTLKMGNGALDGINIGPLISATAVQDCEKFIADATSRGAKLVLGGKRPDAAVVGRGHFFEPTVLANVSHDMRVCQEEIFGPIVPVVSFSTEDEVLALANSVPVGLASYFYSSDYRRQWRFAERLQYGMVGINEGLISDPTCPFGGVKESGIGRDGSKYGMENFLDTCYVLHGGH